MIEISNFQEPIISVGVILPEDKQKKLLVIDSQNGAEFKISIKKNNLIVNEKIISSLSLRRKHQSSENSYYLLKSVIAGRGFHWQKKISIKVKGDLFISKNSGSIFLVNNIPVETYLMCVATSEMSGECPNALLEAQTVAARSWLISASEKKHRHLKIDVCNDDCCQRYQGISNLTSSSIKASKRTFGTVLTHNDSICDTRYSKSCGGHSENNENVWGGNHKKYLKGIPDKVKNSSDNLMDEKEFTRWIENPPNSFCNDSIFKKGELKKYLGSVDESKSYFRWKYKISQIELTKNINKKALTSFHNIKSITSLKRGVSGRILKIKIIGFSSCNQKELVLDTEYEIRRVLHPKFLFSSSFIVQTNFNNNNSIPNNFIFKGSGWGHGVGLCQIGALKMALNGESSEQILNHYFSSTEVKKIYE
tara:strand:+ start:1685 stop:2947 length:1263 start_codon:yes stop_codon:yes gene_type:complete